MTGLHGLRNAGRHLQFAFLHLCFYLPYPLLTKEGKRREEKGKRIKVKGLGGVLGKTKADGVVPGDSVELAPV